MGLRRHWPLLAVVLGCLWFGSIVYWASRDFVDNVPVGTDYNLVPPASVNAKVECRSPLSSTVRGAEPLPALTPQPADQPPLAYTREPCIARRDSARQALVIDSVVFVGLIAAVAVARVRKVSRQPARIEGAVGVGAVASTESDT